MNIAPIILFVYNRFSHTVQTLESLKNNSLSIKSDLFIYSDGNKNEIDLIEVQKIRKYLKTVSGFRNVFIIERTENYGLAKNILDGVSTVIKKYSKAIILEDDIITNQYFLDYMNDALTIYEDNEKIMHISGYMYPINTNKLPDFFTLCQATCWGWATWETSWNRMSIDIDFIIKSIEPQKARFNLDNSFPFYYQLIANKKNKIRTWAIFWYSTIFLNNGVAIHPKYSFTQNIGHDNSGENCGDTNFFFANLIQNYEVTQLINLELTENTNARKYLNIYFKKFKKSIFYRVVKKIKNIYEIYSN